MKWFARLWQPLQRLYGFWYCFRYRNMAVIVVDDIPDDPSPGYLYLVGENEDYWAASMRCPCGCGDTTTLNLIGPHPVWQAVKGEFGKVGLHPSVHRQTGCNSHYWIRDGAVVWANSTRHRSWIAK